MIDDICYYCGLPADVIDHVIPKIVLKSHDAVGHDIRKNRTLTVPACRECNSLLSASVQKTLQERKRELKIRLKRKYKKLLIMPEWNEEELSELSPRLRQYIEASQKHKQLVKLRILY